MDVTTRIQAAVVRADMALVAASKIAPLLLMGAFFIYIIMRGVRNEL